jgi:RNA polymerase sigma factor (sigma-70 family)
MISTHHQQRDYIKALDAERSARAGRFRKQAPESELELLVRRAAAGEQPAWNALVKKFTRRLTGIARSYRLNAHDVEDVVQLTFVRLHAHIHTLRDANALPGWLDTTVRRETLRRLRSSGRERPLEAGIVENLPAVEEEPVKIPSEQLRTELAAAVGRLPDRQRRLLEVLYVEETPSYDVISRELDMPIGSIGPTRGRAMQRLRRDARLLEVAERDADQLQPTEPSMQAHGVDRALAWLR